MLVLVFANANASLVLQCFSALAPALSVHWWSCV